MTVPNTAEKRYGALRFVAMAIQAISIMCGIVGMMSSLICMGSMGGWFFLGLLGTAIFCLMMWASSEIIELLIDLEENTRNTVLKLYQADSSLCSNCGKYYSGNSAHCPNCGAKIST